MGCGWFVCVVSVCFVFWLIWMWCYPIRLMNRHGCELLNFGVWYM